MSDNSNQRAPKPNRSLGRKIIISVISILVLLAVAIGLLGYHYFQEALKPMNPQNTNVTQVHIPLGASNKQIGSILQNKKIVRSGMVFDYYVKSNKMSDFRAGYYQLKPSMALKTIAKRVVPISQFRVPREKCWFAKALILTRSPLRFRRQLIFPSRTLST